MVEVSASIKQARIPLINFEDQHLTLRPLSSDVKDYLLTGSEISVSLVQEYRPEKPCKIKSTRRIEDKRYVQHFRETISSDKKG